MVCCFDPPAELDDLLQLLLMRKVSAAASQPDYHAHPQWREPKEHNSDDQPAGAYDDGSAHRRGVPAQPSVVARKCIQPLSCWTLASPASRAKAWLISSAARSGLHPVASWQLQVPAGPPDDGRRYPPAPATAQWAAPYGARENRETNVSDDIAVAERQRDLEKVLSK
jgi:hypothetical protein